MLTQLDKATVRMIEDVPKELEHAGAEKRLEAVKGELEIVNVELKTVKVDLRLSQEHERSSQQSRGQALHQLDRMTGTQDPIRDLAKVFEREYKGARKDALQAKSLVESAHAENFEFSEAKHKAEQRCRRQEAYFKTADETIMELRAESAVNKARIVEHEGKYGV